MIYNSWTAHIKHEVPLTSDEHARVLEYLCGNHDASSNRHEVYVFDLKSKFIAEQVERGILSILRSKV